MSIYHLTPTRETVHGYFSRDLQPVLTVDSGDTVVFQTIDAGWKLGPDPDTRQLDWDRHVEWYDPETDKVHALGGPVEIRGAEPGMTLEVRIGEVRTGRWGWAVGGGWKSYFNERLGLEDVILGLVWRLDPDTNVATTAQGHRLATRPFAGVMGMPPDKPGVLPTAPPRTCGGNLDCKELVSGTWLYLPIALAGGLFSAGDGHAVQGDGEVSGVAIECPLERLELTLTLKPDMRIATPRAWTPEGWITFGLDEDLDEATMIALEAMLDLMGELHGYERVEAMALASLTVDLRITQIVNGVKGVHAVLPHGALGGE